MTANMPTNLQKENLKPFLPIVGIAVLLILMITATGIIFFVHSRSVVEELLKDKLRSTATATAMQFTGETIDRIQPGDTLESSPTLQDTVQRLESVRQSVSNIRYIYIMRKTNDPRMLAFVADADQSLTDAQLDTNKNGIVDESEAAAETGELYDWSNFPLLGTDAFQQPSVDEHISQDEWGSIISGYAPIYNKNGSVAAVLGIDMSGEEYGQLVQSIFSPMALLLSFIAAFCVGTSGVLLLWQKRIENLQRLELERNGLLRLAFHQLGGPLTIINWSLEELEEEGPASIHRTIVNIHEGVKRLSDILKTLKSADLVHAKKIEYKPEFSSLSSVIERVVKNAGTKLAVRKQHVELNLVKNITMNIDVKLMAGVVEELLTNAIDFSSEGGTIVVSSRRKGSMAEFSIADHGCGIPKHDLERIFDEFTRGANATTFKADGNGLGLYIVRGIVEQAGGKIIVHSKEGVGTTVTVRLPMKTS